MKRVADDNVEKVDGFPDGPEIGKGFEDMLDTAHKAARADEGPGSFTLELQEGFFTPASALEFCKWYEETAYLADRRPTLRESKRFKAELYRQTHAIVETFLASFSHSDVLFHPFFDFTPSRAHVKFAFVARESGMGKFLSDVPVYRATK